MCKQALSWGTSNVRFLSVLVWVSLVFEDLLHSLSAVGKITGLLGGRWVLWLVIYWLTRVSLTSGQETASYFGARVSWTLGMRLSFLPSIYISDRKRPGTASPSLHLYTDCGSAPCALCQCLCIVCIACLWIVVCGECILSAFGLWFVVSVYWVYWVPLDCGVVSVYWVPLYWVWLYPACSFFGTIAILIHFMKS